LREFSLEKYVERNFGACWKGTLELVGKEHRSLLERDPGACWKGMPELVGKERRSLLEKERRSLSSFVALSSSGTFEKKWRVPVISSLIDAISDKTS
jgi:hypothetical protein